MDKRGQGLSLNTIIVAIIVLIVLVVLVMIFTGLLLGMMLGEFMPWKDTNDLLPFNSWHYVQPFLYLVLPSLFFGGSVFFVSGALSRKLIVFYGDEPLEN